MRRIAGLFLLPILLLASSTRFARAAQGSWSTAGCGDDEGNTHNRFWWGHQERVCELRITTIKLGGQHLAVTSENGGIEVSGEDRGDVVIEARVQAWAGSAADANKLLKEVVIETSGDSIRDHGPHFLVNSGYGVNYRLRVPRRLAVDLKSDNGGIDIAHLEGNIHFDTTNGGVGLKDLAGDVHGSTVNGGLDIALSGDRWQGKGLSAETTNGGVSLSIPGHYSAQVETGTVNGGIHVDFPITVQGDIKNRLSATLGSGGPTIRAETTNGGVEINRASGAQ
jgi:hypothetical protein